MARGRQQAVFVGTLAVALAASATVAVAFTAPMVLYMPPVVKMFDIETNDSVENMVVNQDGDYLLFSNTPALVAMHPNSDPGCDIDVAVACPKQGIKKIVMNLGAMEDSGEFDLDAGTAHKVKQIAKGGTGNDDLKGRGGAQVLKGGEGNDELEGGPGKDVLVGGPGADLCDGGPGNDTVKDCESPMRQAHE
jgi:Ca2+-binding RTX toxin-like protein